VSALDAANGNLLWQTHTIAETPSVVAKTAEGKEVWGPSGAGIWSSPTVDSQAHVLYVTTGDNYSAPATPTSDAVLALDLDSGKIVWSRQFTEGDVFNLACITRHDPSCKPDTGPDFDFGSSPILMALSGGKRTLIAAQKSGMIYALDPDHRGQLLWKARAGKGGSLGGIQWGPATDGRTIFAAISDLAFLKSEDPTKLNINPEVGGGLAAYAVDSGREEWKAPAASCGERRPCSPAQSAAVTAIPGVVFSGSLDGHLRAYSAAGGKVLWDFDTERSFDTRNGVAANGGSLDVAGPVVAEGMVFVVSGYPAYGGKSGNALLAFTTEQ
jgi:polyvinyl alcohol dehydrogenase (cytochrome)